MSLRPLPRLLASRLPQCRNFTRSTQFALPKPRPPPLGKKAPPIPAARRPPAPTSKHPPLASPRPQGSPKDDLLTTPPSSFRGYADKLLGRDPGAELCLYKSPPHAGLIFGSYFAAGTFFVNAYSMSSLLQMSTAPWYATGVIVVGITIVSAIGTGIWMTPLKLLRRVTLHRMQSGDPVLRFEGRKPLIPWATLVIEARPEEVWVNKNVPGALTTWNSVPFKDSAAWTDDVALTRVAKAGERKPGLFEGPMNAVAKMFWREGMVYVRIRNQNWKMDLVGCEILGNGNPFMKVVQEDHGIRDGALSLWRRYSKVFR